MKTTYILSLLTMGALALAEGTNPNDPRMCQKNSDPNTCTVTILAEEDRAFPGSTGSIETTWGYVLSNECETIIDSTTCNKDGSLCWQTIKDGTGATLPVKRQTNQVTLSGHGPDNEGLRMGIPLFSVYYGDNASVSDDANNKDPCTCAPATDGLKTYQYCSCWIDCSN